MSLIKVAQQMRYDFLFIQRKKGEKKHKVIGACVFVCVCVFGTGWRDWGIGEGEFIKISKR